LQAVITSPNARREGIRKESNSKAPSRGCALDTAAISHFACLVAMRAGFESACDRGDLSANLAARVTTVGHRGLKVVLRFEQVILRAHAELQGGGALRLLKIGKAFCVRVTRKSRLASARISAGNYRGILAFFARQHLCRRFCRGSPKVCVTSENVGEELERGPSRSPNSVTRKVSSIALALIAPLRTYLLPNRSGSCSRE